MRAGILAVNGLVVGIIVSLLVLGTEQRTSPVVTANVEGAALTALEDRVALGANAEDVWRLASGYLDRGEPGLASAVIAAAPVEMQNQPEIRYVEARTLFGQGRVAEALAASRAVVGQCEKEGCPPWLTAKTARQLAFLEEIDAAGIDDPLNAPEATRAAYERSLHRVLMVAMR